MPAGEPPDEDSRRTPRILKAVPSPPSDDHFSVHLGHRLRELCEQRGLTQEVAAVTAGITRNTLVKLEGARFPNPQLSTLLSLMQCYELRSIDELIGPMPAARLAHAWQAAGWPNTRQRRQPG
ncbi:helix-turn-helix transcriptional regulator [Amycolatopsis sp. NPDC058278]|uniref:helix-turn-helix transcriptional regulator n=1 Tax=Amycolatopsis sp. NPDC058278 TaxID=3346417 RepID=UPI0036DCBAFC